MNIRRVCLLCLLMLAASPVLAVSTAVREMAGILVKLEHYSNAAEKSRLKDIAASKDTTAQEKVVANAMINLKHTAADADKVKLKQVMEDSTVPTEVHELAEIILGLNHVPSAADKQMLQQMMK